MPYDLAVMERAEPIYESLPGWSEDITQARRLTDLPANARRYITRIEEILGVPISAIGVGPARDQVVLP
jgi:adenylosuccinate synthase